MPEPRKIIVPVTHRTMSPERTELLAEAAKLLAEVMGEFDRAWTQGTAQMVQWHEAGAFDDER